jgi:hypothetical protein
VATTTKVAISSFATGAVQRSTSQRGPTAAATSSTLGNMTNPNNLVSVGALPRTLPISGDPQAGNDPPPSYRESFQD